MRTVFFFMRILPKLCGALLLACSVLCAQTAPPAAPPQAAKNPDPIERLLNVARLWITVKYFHPYLAYRQDIDWDKALVDSLPKIIAAKSPSEYRAAIDALMAPLHDEPMVLSDTRDPRVAGGERRWVHFGLRQETSSVPFYPGFYSAFESRLNGSEPETLMLPMGEGVNAFVRLAEYIPKDGPAFPQPRPENSYAGQRYPSLELRTLAAFKIWGVFKYFFAYRDLLDEDWDVLFARSLPKIQNAKDAREYNLAIAEFVAHVYDSNAKVKSEELDDFFGVAPPPLILRLIEKKPLVTRILDEAAVKGEVKVGDVVLKVDGEDMGDRIRREIPYISSSTQQWLGERLMERILNGPDGSTVTLTVRGPDAREREVELTRKTAYEADMQYPRFGDVMKTLPGNIGYVDLNRLRPPDYVPDMLDKFRETKAIIFDLRGQPWGTDYEIASRLTEKEDVPGAIINGPITLAPDSDGGNLSSRSASYFYVQTVPKDSEWKYKGKTVALVDERTIGSAEHICLLLEAANHTAFIGSPSAGAYSAVTNFVVPGGITIFLSGLDIRHGNSGALQRTGLQPEVTVVPSIVGIRQGRDEVLDKAVEFLKQ